MKSVPILLFAVLVTCNVIAQIKHPKRGLLFDDTRVHKVEILVDTTDLSAMNRNRESNDEYPATFIIHYEYQSDTITEVGIRPKGNYSRQNEKVSFKIGFNTFTKGRKYKGLEKLSLNGYRFGTAHIRANLAARIITEAGIATTRSSFSELYLNNEFVGVYSIFEHIDEEYTKSRFGSKTGNLYKCLLQSNLTYRGQDVSSYDTIVRKRPMYELKTNKEAYDYSGLMELTNILSNTPLEELEGKLEARFNVEDFIKEMALEVLLGHWDGTLMHCNNYYLYDNPKTGKFDLIPYDFDLTFGIDLANEDMARKDIYNWPPQLGIVNNPDTISNASKEERDAFLEIQSDFIFDSRRPAYYRLLAIDKYRNQYNYQLNYIINETSYNRDSAYNEIDRLFSLLKPSLIKEYGAEEVENLNILLHEGFDDFVMHIGSYRFKPVQYGVKEFIDVRTTTIKETLEPIKSLITLNHVHEKNKDNVLVIRVKAEGDMPQKVSLFVSKKKNKFQEYTMYDDGLNGDKRAGDGVYSYQIPEKDLKGKKYYISTTQSDDVLVREPYSGYFNNY